MPREHEPAGPERLLHLAVVVAVIRFERRRAGVLVEDQEVDRWSRTVAGADGKCLRDSRRDWGSPAGHGELRQRKHHEERRHGPHEAGHRCKRAAAHHEEQYGVGARDEDRQQGHPAWAEHRGPRRAHHHAENASVTGERHHTDGREERPLVGVAGKRGRTEPGQGGHDEHRREGDDQLGYVQPLPWVGSGQMQHRVDADQERVNSRPASLASLVCTAHHASPSFNQVHLIAEGTVQDDRPEAHVAKSLAPNQWIAGGPGRSEPSAPATPAVFG